MCNLIEYETLFGTNSFADVSKMDFWYFFFHPFLVWKFQIRNVTKYKNYNRIGTESVKDRARERQRSERKKPIVKKKKKNKAKNNWELGHVNNMNRITSTKWAYAALGWGYQTKMSDINKYPNKKSKSNQDKNKQAFHKNPNQTKLNHIKNDQQIKCKTTKTTRTFKWLVIATVYCGILIEIDSFKNHFISTIDRV